MSSTFSQAADNSTLASACVEHQGSQRWFFFFFLSTYPALSIGKVLLILAAFEIPPEYIRAFQSPLGHPISQFLLSIFWLAYCLLQLLSTASSICEVKQLPLNVFNRCTRGNGFSHQADFKTLNDRFSSGVFQRTTRLVFFHGWKLLVFWCYHGARESVMGMGELTCHKAHCS